MTVVKQEWIAGLDSVGQRFKCRRDAARLSREIADDDAKLVARVQRDWLATFERTGPDLGAAEILKDGNGASGTQSGAANAPDDLAVALVCAVGKIQADHVDASGEELAENSIAARRRAERGDDLRVPHQMLQDYRGISHVGTAEVALPVQSSP
jgi:hypothetical protein